MDNAVALVQAYLHVNGYFTVTEYPVVEAIRYGGYRTATDLDIFAFRFHGAGRLVPEGDAGHLSGADSFAPDPALGSVGESADMIIGEVKEGRAELNQGARDPAVLRAALTRFGCCSAGHVRQVVEALLRKGHAKTPCGHRVRLVAFGSTIERNGNQKYAAVSFGHVVGFLQDYIQQHWEALRHTQFKDSTLGFLLTLEKARHLTAASTPSEGG
jgi:hypothetical protein